jgi:crotonobetainyl-CoA:carnitine CoA-transferase CaiB-like acyl-CoA transferase
MKHERLGNIRMLGAPVRLHKTPIQLRQAPPDLGEHSIEIVQSMGYKKDEVSVLLKEGVIG